MRFEPNAVGIPTKWLPSMRPGSFFSDKDFDDWKKESTPDIERLMQHKGAIIWPTDGIGSGRARLQKNAPLIWNAIKQLETELLKG